jgi:hypothetical protein
VFRILSKHEAPYCRVRRGRVPTKSVRATGLPLSTQGLFSATEIAGQKMTSGRSSNCCLHPDASGWAERYHGVTLPRPYVLHSRFTGRPTLPQSIKPHIISWRITPTSFTPQELRVLSIPAGSRQQQEVSQFTKHAHKHTHSSSKTRLISQLHPVVRLGEIR